MEKAWPWGALLGFKLILWLATQGGGLGFVSTSSTGAGDIGQDVHSDAQHSSV